MSNSYGKVLYGFIVTLSSDYQRRFSVIQTVLEQGKNLFAGKKVSNRIVSINRHYLRPIIRDKETKSVEFGAKVNNIQIDEISFIEHISFKAFNEVDTQDGSARINDFIFRGDYNERSGASIG